MPRKSTYMEKFTGVMLESKYGDNYIIHNSEAFPTYNVTAICLEEFNSRKPEIKTDERINCVEYAK